MKAVIETLADGSTGQWLETYCRNCYKIFSDSKINVLEYPTQIPDLNPTEKLWAYSKKKFKDRNLSNLKWCCGSEIFNL